MVIISFPFPNIQQKYSRYTQIIMSWLSFLITHICSSVNILLCDCDTSSRLSSYEGSSDKWCVRIIVYIFLFQAAETIQNYRKSLSVLLSASAFSFESSI